MNHVTDITRWYKKQFVHCAGALRPAACLVVVFCVTHSPFTSFAQERPQSAWQLTQDDDVATQSQPPESEGIAGNNSEEPFEEDDYETEPAFDVGDEEIDIDTDFSDEELAQTEDDETFENIPLERRPIIRTTPVVDVSSQLRQNLEQQYQLVKTIEEEEDAFNESLGEAYMGYGQLLAQAGRLDEAREMFARALHLSKINNGVYAMEQRPVLRAMFNLHDAKGEIGEMERYLRQIIWLEKKNPDKQDDYSYDMVLKFSNLLIDEYLAWPKITESALDTITKSIHYLTYASKRYATRPLNESVPPYGELALLYYLKYHISVELNRTSLEHVRSRDFSKFDPNPKPVALRPTVVSRPGFVSSAFRQLHGYLNKAIEEQNVEHQVRALRDMGDLHLLFNRHKDAAKYYQQAWLAAADLDDDHELVKSFQKPAKLPDFNYAGKRAVLDRKVESIYVPLVMNLDRFGRVEKILSERAGNPYPKYVFRAKRTSRKFIFRPTIDNGNMVATNDFEYKVRLFLRPRQVALSSEDETP